MINATRTYGTRKYCSWCFATEHDAKSCEKLTLRVQEGLERAIVFNNKLNTKGRVCSTCGEETHTSTTCKKRFDAKQKALFRERSKLMDYLDWFREIGFGPGAMLTGMSSSKYWSSRPNKEEKIVIIKEFSPRVLKWFKQNMVGDKPKNWYFVDAVDLEFNEVRKIYLPYHPVFAPMPASKRVQIIQKGSLDDLVKEFSKYDCMSNPMLGFDSAEAFFNAGYKFKPGNSTTKVEVALKKTK